jgi:hypothetical protein
VVEAAERRYQLPDREAVRRSPLFARFLLGAVVCSTAISADMRVRLPHLLPCFFFFMKKTS